MLFALLEEIQDKKPELIHALHSISFYSKYNSVQ